MPCSTCFDHGFSRVCPIGAPNFHVKLGFFLGGFGRCSFWGVSLFRAESPGCPSRTAYESLMSASSIFSASSRCQVAAGPGQCGPVVPQVCLKMEYPKSHGINPCLTMVNVCSLGILMGPPIFKMMQKWLGWLGPGLCCDRVLCQGFLGPGVDDTENIQERPNDSWAKRPKIHWI